MNTIVLEMLRLGTSYNYNLSPDQKYLVLCGNYPHVEVSFHCDQRTFNQKVRQLRYTNSEEVRLSAISFFQELLSEPMNKLEALKVEAQKSTGSLHIRLVTTAKELIQIPFELSLTPSGIEGASESNLLLNHHCPTTLTREIRQVKPPSYDWPFLPRILFIYADPKEAVPHEAHTSVFVEILTELASPIVDSLECVPDLSPLITIVRKASLQKIRNEIRKAIDDQKPYTHIHILAHGIKATDEDLEFCILLHPDDDLQKASATTGKELAQSLVYVDGSYENLPAVVSLMVCDSGNEGSPVLSSGSLAFELHESGVPCLFASQFPLTQDGSVSLTKSLYTQLLILGQDPREALIDIRKDLSNHFHDWASLVALVRFPADIENQIQDSRLKLLFKAMKVAQTWSEYLSKNEAQIKPEKIEALRSTVDIRLAKAIDYLESYLEKGLTTRLSADLKTEHLGLLGSAYKRRAEFIYKKSLNISGETSKKLKEDSHQMLQRAVEFYKNGFNTLVSSHWNGMQYLSLKAVLTGSITEEKELWTVIHFMAKREQNIAKTKIDRIWSYGTLVELYLLKPLTAHEHEFQSTYTDSLNLARHFYTLILESGLQEVLGSTQRQLGRYIDWWPDMLKGIFPAELSQIATDILETKTHN